MSTGLNSFIRKRIMTKSSDLLLAFSNEKHRNPHIKIGIGLHVLFYYEVLLLKLIFYQRQLVDR